MKAVTTKKNGIEIRVKVLPKSSRSEIAGEIEGRLKLKLNSPPVEGAANKELIKLLSKKLRIAKSSLSIINGERSRLKTIFALTADTKSLEAKLDALVNPC